MIETQIYLLPEPRLLAMLTDCLLDFAAYNPFPSCIEMYGPLAKHLQLAATVQLARM